MIVPAGGIPIPASGSGYAIELPFLARFPFERNRSNDKKSRKIKILEQVPDATKRPDRICGGPFCVWRARALRREFSQGIWAAFTPLHVRAGLALLAIAETVAKERLHELVSLLASFHRREFLGRAAATHDIEFMFSRNQRFQRVIARKCRNRAAQRRRRQERKSKTSLLSIALACFAHRRILPRNGFHVKARRRLRAHAGRVRATRPG
jgi:hypothetical protein